MIEVMFFSEKNTLMLEFEFQAIERYIVHRMDPGPWYTI
jgi:hypothetical protein